MSKRNAGFTLVEMLVVIGIFGFVLAATSQMFVSMLRTHRQQSRITETNIEGIIGLELFRQDLEKAGYGLPWNMGGFSYSEKQTDTLSLNELTSNPPRGIVSADNQGWHGSDYLAIKAANVATNSACSKWAFLKESGDHSNWLLLNGVDPAPSENLDNNDWVIVISPGTPNSPTERTLITGGTHFSAVNSPGIVAPLSQPEARIIYGIDSGTGLGNLRMPFNRADYFIIQPSSTDMPKRCAPGTGILYKAVVNQGNGEYSYMPLLDCVADMQVIFRDFLVSGGTTSVSYYEDTRAYDAPTIRKQIKEARVFILAQEGQKDTDYQHPSATEHVGDPGYGRDFNFSANSINDWRNFRWKIYTLVVKLDNLQ